MLLKEDSHKGVTQNPSHGDVLENKSLVVQQWGRVCPSYEVIKSGAGLEESELLPKDRHLCSLWCVTNPFEETGLLSISNYVHSCQEFPFQVILGNARGECFVNYRSK